MRFKNLNGDEIKHIIETYHDKESGLTYEKRATKLSNEFDVSERTIRYWWKNLGLTEKSEPEPEQYTKAKGRAFNKDKKRLLITWAQNNTKPHRKFFDKMKAYAEFHNADIHVIAGRYKNPTSVNSDKDSEFWNDEIVPYLDANRHSVHKYLTILSDVKVQPTAINPMSGLQAMSGEDSCIFGSPRVQFEVIPSMEGHKAKKMWTTGACTIKNYTDSKAGKKGEFHHTLGFVIVEFEDDETYHVRQVTANNNGDFSDLFFRVTDEGVSRIKNVEAIVLGDVHLGDTDPLVMKATTQLMDAIKPKHTVLHDLFNGHSISHHDIKDPIKQYTKLQNGTNSLKLEINQMLEWLAKMEKYNLVIVRSNHDDFVDRWIVNQDWKKDVANAMEYMEYTQLLLGGKAPKGIIPYIIDNKFKKIKTLNRDESFRVKDWELGAHGDIGANGSRGSLLQFRRLNMKMITGHTHSPARKDGALSVGTSTRLRVGYNLGPSSWLNSHVIIHECGKAQHIIIENGRYTTFE